MRRLRIPPHPLTRADKGTSLGFAVGRGRPLFALTPSPSPTLWERGVGARGSAPCSAFPLSRPAGEGDKGGEGKKARLPVHAHAGKSPLPQRFCAESMYPYQGKGVRVKRKMRPEESGRTLLDFTEVGGVELHTPATVCRLSSIGGGAAPADPPDPNRAQSCSQAQGQRW